MRRRRGEIQHSAKLKSAALQFWTMAGLTADDAMSKDTYCKVHRRISKALAPELSDEEAAEAADDDWSDDLGGAAEMRFDQYAAGLFGGARHACARRVLCGIGGVLPAPAVRLVRADGARALCGQWPTCGRTVSTSSSTSSSSTSYSGASPSCVRHARATLLVAVARPLCMRTRIRPRPPRRHRAAGPTPHARPSPPLQRASAQRATFLW